MPANKKKTTRLLLLVVPLAFVVLLVYSQLSLAPLSTEVHFNENGDVQQTDGPLNTNHNQRMKTALSGIVQQKLHHEAPDLTSEHSLAALSARIEQLAHAKEVLALNTTTPSWAAIFLGAEHLVPIVAKQKPTSVATTGDQAVVVLSEKDPTAMQHDPTTALVETTTVIESSKQSTTSRSCTLMQQLYMGRCYGANAAPHNTVISKATYLAAVDALTREEREQKLAPEIVAHLLNTLWQQASMAAADNAQLPQPATLLSPFSPADIQAWYKNNEAWVPTVNDFVQPILPAKISSKAPLYELPFAEQATS